MSITEGLFRPSSWTHSALLIEEEETEEEEEEEWLVRVAQVLAGSSGVGGRSSYQLWVFKAAQG